MERFSSAGSSAEFRGNKSSVGAASGSPRAAAYALSGTASSARAAEELKLRSATAAPVLAPPVLWDDEEEESEEAYEEEEEEDGELALLQMLSRLRTAPDGLGSLALSQLLVEGRLPHYGSAAEAHEEEEEPAALACFQPPKPAPAPPPQTLRNQAAAALRARFVQALVVDSLDCCEGEHEGDRPLHGLPEDAE